MPYLCSPIWKIGRVLRRLDEIARGIDLEEPRPLAADLAAEDEARRERFAVGSNSASPSMSRTSRIARPTTRAAWNMVSTANRLGGAVLARDAAGPLGEEATRRPA